MARSSRLTILVQFTLPHPADCNVDFAQSEKPRVGVVLSMANYCFNIIWGKQWGRGGGGKLEKSHENKTYVGVIRKDRSMVNFVQVS